MWLDGIFMAEFFYTQYTLLFKEPDHFNDIALQFTLMEKRARDAKPGLLHHDYDEPRQQAWADPQIERLPGFWGRAVGLHFVALVDTLDFFPSTHVAKRDDLVAILQPLVEAVAKVQDPATRACAGEKCWIKGGGRKITWSSRPPVCLFMDSTYRNSDVVLFFVTGFGFDLVQDFWLETAELVSFMVQDSLLETAELIQDWLVSGLVHCSVTDQAQAQAQAQPQSSVL
ncbi:hypothetical protein L7F22_034995 [Adiantum nelumboides]|nr:hypothetical protein [Adiantum nelumboides]